MAHAYSRIAALRPADTNEAALYLVPASTEIIATLTICNQDTSSRTYKVAHCNVTGSATGEDWLANTKAIGANDTQQITGISMGAAEELRVQASVADKLSFVLAGLSIT